jgi:hypothetical protein
MKGSAGRTHCDRLVGGQLREPFLDVPGVFKIHRSVIRIANSAWRTRCALPACFLRFE